MIEIAGLQEEIAVEAELVRFGPDIGVPSNAPQNPTIRFAAQWGHSKEGDPILAVFIIRNPPVKVNAETNEFWYRKEDVECVLYNEEGTRSFVQVFRASVHWVLSH